jgi:2-dehydropantoate 2-reductase
VLQIPGADVPELDWSGQAVVLLSVKSQQTRAALLSLASVAPPRTPIICLQNGVANEPAALRYFAHVQGVCVAMPASHMGPGVVQAWSSPITGLLDLGVYPRGTNLLTERVAAELSAASFDSHPLPDIRRWKYRKLLTNLGNVVEAVCGPQERDGALEAILVDEGEQVLTAAGIDAATAAEDRERRGALLRRGEIDGRTRPGGSTWQSLQRRTGDLETDYLNGEIVLLGREHGVPTPANALLQRLGRGLAVSRAAPGAVSAEEILRRLHESSKRHRSVYRDLQSSKGTDDNRTD